LINLKMNLSLWTAFYRGTMSLKPNTTTVLSANVSVRHFIACHIDGDRFMKVQLKGRLTLDQKYEGKDIHIAFRHGEQCYVYPHDEMVKRVEKLGNISSSASWSDHRSYSWPQPPLWAKKILEAYKV